MGGGKSAGDQMRTPLAEPGQKTPWAKRSAARSRARRAGAPDAARTDEFPVVAEKNQAQAT